MPALPSAVGNAGRYTTIAMILHWIVALGILALLGIGLIMKHGGLPPQRMFQLFQLHKSIGITVLFAVILRIIWRLTHAAPALPATMPRIERKAAHAGHIALYALMLGLPLLGWGVVSASAFSIPTVLFGEIPWPDLPVLPNMDHKDVAEGILTALHKYGAWLMIALLAAHIGAVLRHRFVLHDGVAGRMIFLPRFSKTPHSPSVRKA